MPDKQRKCPHCGSNRFSNIRVSNIRDVTVSYTFDEYGGMDYPRIMAWGSAFYMPYCDGCGANVEFKDLV